MHSIECTTNTSRKPVSGIWCYYQLLRWGWGAKTCPDLAQMADGCVRPRSFSLPQSQTKWRVQLNGPPALALRTLKHNFAGISSSNLHYTYFATMQLDKSSNGVVVVVSDSIAQGLQATSWSGRRHFL
jgi:hypothetical protein